MYSKIIYFTQLSHKNGKAFQNNHMPLAIGLLSEYLKNSYNDKSLTIKLFKDPTELNKSLQIEKPDIIFFSLYMWNEKLSLAFAKEIKELNPETFIVMGGPNISLVDEKNYFFLKENNFIDVLVKGDGEQVVLNIVNNYYDTFNKNKKLLSYGCSYVIINNKFIVNEGCDSRLGIKGNESLDKIPSPYLTKAFDKFFIDGSIPLIETNRGCPFSCTYCQQGEKYFSKIRNYSMSHIKSEIEYIAKKIFMEKLKISILEIADPNFAMYERDSEFIDFIKIMQTKYNYPKEIWCSTGKNKTKLIVSNINRLKKNTILMRAAVQSTDEKTLIAIKRKNIKLDTYFDVMKEYEDKGLSTGADIMLGLPLESIQSHIEGFYNLIDKNITEFAALQTILLKGTAMELDSYIEQYDLKTKYRVIPECNGTYTIYNKTQNIIEFEKIIISTNSLSFEDYLTCRKFHLILMVFHNTRLLQPIYKICNYFNIKRSEILKNIFELTINQYSIITDDFIKDTHDELLDSESITFSKKEINILTSNKIFRHLAIILFQRKNIVLEILSKSLEKLINNKLIVDELLIITNNSIINIFDVNLSKIEYSLKNDILIDILGSTCIIEITQDQMTKIELLKNIYTTNSEIISNIMYHLRPKNSVKTLRFVR